MYLSRVCETLEGFSAEEFKTHLFPCFLIAQGEVRETVPEPLSPTPGHQQRSGPRAPHQPCGARADSARHPRGRWVWAGFALMCGLYSVPFDNN